mgnify:CR=1 FL=1
MLEIVIQNWEDLQKAVFDDVWDDKIMRYRANRIYRGAADKDWRLVPSLNRVCGHNLKLEQAVFRSFRMAMQTLPSIPDSVSFCPWRNTMDCPRACWTGRIRRWWPRTLPLKIPTPTTATARFGASTPRK